MTMTNRELAEALRQALMEDEIPVPVRALLAGALMCARGGAPTRLGMAKVGGYSYGSSQTHYSELLDALVTQLPKAIGDMASGEVDPAAAARLRDQVQEREQTIVDLRADLVALSARHEQVRRYALALHERLRSLDGNGSLTEAAVLPLRPSRVPKS